MRTASYSGPLAIIGILVLATSLQNCSGQGDPSAPPRGYPVISSLPCESKAAAAKAPAVPLRQARMLDANRDVVEQGCWYAGATQQGMQATVALVWDDGSTEAYPFAVFAYYGFKYDQAQRRYVPNYTVGANGS